MSEFIASVPFQLSRDQQQKWRTSSGKNWNRGRLCGK